MSQVFGSPYFYALHGGEAHLQSMIIVTLNPSLTPKYTLGIKLGLRILKEEKISPLFFLYTRIFTTFANNQMIFMESPTNRIKEVLIEKGIKQTWLAEKLGKSFTIVNSYVYNRRQPSLELLFQIAEILQVNPKELINTLDE